VVNMSVNSEASEKVDRDFVPEAEFPPEPLYSYQVPKTEEKNTHQQLVLQALFWGVCVLLCVGSVVAIGIFISRISPAAKPTAMPDRNGPSKSAS